MKAERLDEVHITKDFSLNEAISSLRFHYELAKKHGKKLVMEIWEETDEPKAQTVRKEKTALGWGER